MKNHTSVNGPVIHAGATQPMKCRWCGKVIKPVKGCWYQVYCTGGKCRAAYNRDLLKRGKELAKKTPRTAASAP